MEYLIRHSLSLTDIMKGIINGCKGIERLRKIFIGVMVEMARCNGYLHMKILVSNIEE